MVRRSRGNVVFTALAALFVLGAALVTPSSAHDSPSIAHTWRRHYRKLAQRIFYTKATSDARFVNTGEQASDAALLDGLDSTSFAPAGHGHAGEDITSGTVAEARIAAALARDAEVFAIVTGSDGADSGLDADLLDGQSSTAFAAASHVHAGDDITSGTVDESVIDALIARVADVFGLVLAADGANSGLDADLLDGQSSAAFAAAVHTHAGEETPPGRSPRHGSRRRSPATPRSSGSSPTPTARTAASTPTRSTACPRRPSPSPGRSRSSGSRKRPTPSPGRSRPSAWCSRRPPT
jgi:hypothetical protein